MTDALLWDLEEAARQLGGVSTRTIRRLIERRELPAVRVLGRVCVPAAAVREWIDRKMQPAHNQECAGPGVRKEVTACHTVAKIVPFGGSASLTQAAKELDVLLARRIARKRKR